MSFEPRDFLRHILVEADYLLGRSESLSFEAFAADETLQRAFIRRGEAIGATTALMPSPWGQRVSRRSL